MLAVGGWILRFMLFGELRQLVFGYGFFKMHMLVKAAGLQYTGFRNLRNLSPQCLDVMEFEVR